ncbi:hypothetical protein [Streptomyces werraensis]|uniref:hypothetical protein n=1 Tax=Streptomyces werraensis TaxID=68284 RepID=UPI00341CF5FB
MPITITDAAGRSRTFLDLGTALALATEPFKVTDTNGRTVTIDPAKIGDNK